MRDDEVTLEKIKACAKAMDEADKHYHEKLARAKSVTIEELRKWKDGKVTKSVT